MANTDGEQHLQHQYSLSVSYIVETSTLAVKTQ